MLRSSYVFIYWIQYDMFDSTWQGSAFGLDDGTYAYPSYWLHNTKKNSIKQWMENGLTAEK